MKLGIAPRLLAATLAMTGAAAPAAAKAALALLASPAGKAAFAGGGVE